MVSRPERRRTAKKVAHDMFMAPPITPNTVVNITLVDVQAVLDANPLFRQAVINAALTRELAEARAELAAAHTSPGQEIKDVA